MSKATFRGLFLAVMVLALWFRLWRLDLRPMHHDEANQAVKFGTLIERGEYRYDPIDHHGPTLYYLTLPSAWARGQRTLAALDERTLRAVPALFGAGLILLFLFLLADLGRDAVLLSALFVALSPSMTYFSRFYIQESLLVFFAFGLAIALGRYVLRPSTGWALAAGICGGLAFATKETSILIFAAAGAALALTLISMNRGRRLTKSTGHADSESSPDSGRRAVKVVHIFGGLAVAALIAVLLYSSFLQNPGGILDSIRALPDYAIRGAGPGPHANPAYYYLALLAFSSSEGVIWTEGLILILALVGAAVAFGGRRRSGLSTPPDSAGIAAVGSPFWPRYLCLYTIFLAAAFSVLRLKTPWNLLSFHAGFILLAGIGAAALLRTARSRFVRSLVLGVILIGCCHLGIQNWRANYVYFADPRNPFVYAQTSPDFIRLVKRVHDLTLVHPDGKDMLVKVVAGPYEQWPLPWYLRDLRRVGYWVTADGAGKFDGVPVVIASQESTGSLDVLLSDRFEAEFYGLRPGTLLAMYIDRALWQKLVAR